MATLTISKLRHDGRFLFAWTGAILSRDAAHIVVEAAWERDVPMFLGYTVFEPGDIFIETYYTGKWFSIWEVRSKRTGRIKGWYCNICRPFELEGDELRFRDMELDVFLFPDGRFAVLDEDDLARADLPDAEKDCARAGLAEVVSWILARRAPFECIGPPRAIKPFWDQSDSKASLPAN